MKESEGDSMITVDGWKLIYRYDSEILTIEPWGNDAVRVRATKCANMPEEDWALAIPQKADAKISRDEEGAVQTGE